MIENWNFLTTISKIVIVCIICTVSTNTDRDFYRVCGESKGTKMSDFGDDEDDLFNDEGAMAQLDASINNQSPPGRQPTSTVRNP